MSKEFKLSMRCENDAFVQHPQAEIVRILRETADRIEQDASLLSPYHKNVLDINGNVVGTFVLK